MIKQSGNGIFQLCLQFDFYSLCKKQFEDKPFIYPFFYFDKVINMISINKKTFISLNKLITKITCLDL